MLHPIKVSLNSTYTSQSRPKQQFPTNTYAKAASSFECDGCSHHASFHSLENPAEDAVRQKWLEQEAAQAREQQAAIGANKKRKMIPQNLLLKDDERIVVLDEFSESAGPSTVKTRKSCKGSTSGPGGG
jgi:hypothetical protein